MPNYIEMWQAIDAAFNAEIGRHWPYLSSLGSAPQKSKGKAESGGSSW